MDLQKITCQASRYILDRSCPSGGFCFYRLDEPNPQALGESKILTVPTAGFAKTEIAVMRCDYMLASQALAQHATSYQVIRDSVTDMASDHYPVFATFEVPK